MAKLQPSCWPFWVVVAGLVPSRVRLSGKVSVTITPIASEGPLFVIVRV